MTNPERTALVFMHGEQAGILQELDEEKGYRFRYLEDYRGPAVSLTMALERREYVFDTFPPFFEGLLPEGSRLEGLLRQRKIDARDYFGQLTAVGKELVGQSMYRLFHEPLPVTYEPCGPARYSAHGLKKLSRSLRVLHDFPYSAAKQRQEAVLRAAKMSIQGVNPKSVRG